MFSRLLYRFPLSDLFNNLPGHALFSPSIDLEHSSEDFLYVASQHDHDDEECCIQSIKTEIYDRKPSEHSFDDSHPYHDQTASMHMSSVDFDSIQIGDPVFRSTSMFISDNGETTMYSDLNHEKQTTTMTNIDEYMEQRDIDNEHKIHQLFNEIVSQRRTNKGDNVDCLLNENRECLSIREKQLTIYLNKVAKKHSARGYHSRSRMNCALHFYQFLQSVTGDVRNLLHSLENHREKECSKKVLLCELKSLSVFLRSSELDDVEQFINGDNTVVMLSSLLVRSRHQYLMSKSLVDLEIVLQVVMCFEALMDIKKGVDRVLETQGIIEFMVLMLDFKRIGYSSECETTTRNVGFMAVLDSEHSLYNNPSPLSETGMTRAREIYRLSCLRILFIARIICSHSKLGFATVVEAMNQYKLFNREKHRFEQMVESIEYALDLEYQTSCIALVNALIYSPDDYTTRSVMYHEFSNLGLSQICQAKCTQSLSDVQLYQFQRYLHFENKESNSLSLSSDNEESNDEKKSDYESEVFSQWTSLNDPSDIISFLQLRLNKHTEAHTSFTNILKFLVLVTLKDSNNNLDRDWRVIELTLSHMLHIRQREMDTSGVTAKEIHLDNVLQEKEHFIFACSRALRKILDGKFHNMSLKSSEYGNNPSNRKFIQLLIELSERMKEYRTGSFRPISSSSCSQGAVKRAEISPAVEGTMRPQSVPEEPKTPVSPQSVSPSEPTQCTPKKVVVPPIIGISSMGPPPPPPPSFGLGNRNKLPTLPELKTTIETKRVYVGSDSITNSMVAKTEWISMIKEYASELAETINVTHIETLFAKKQYVTPRLRQSDQPIQVSFLEESASYRINLMMGYLRLSRDKIKSLIVRMDDVTLGKQSIETLRDIYPDEAKMVEFMSFVEQNRNNMTDADSLLWSLSSIPRIKHRLYCWTTCLEFEHKIETIAPGLNHLITACQQIASSVSLKKLLVLVLDLVNLINNGSKPIYGFKLNFLSKLEDIKSSDNTTNFLSCIAQICTNEMPDLIQELVSGLSSMEPASKIELSELKKEYKKLDSDFQFVNSELELHEHKYQDYGDVVFLQTMRNFQMNAESKLAECKSLIEKFESDALVLKDMYGEDQKEVLEQPHLIFSAMNEFLTKLTTRAKNNQTLAALVSAIKDGNIVDKIKLQRSTHSSSLDGIALEGK